jgi:hypothetical protein
VPAAHTGSTTALFAWTATGAAWTMCSLDESTPELCTSPRVYEGLAAGRHAFVVHVAGPTGAVASQRFEWTVTAPAAAPPPGAPAVLPLPPTDAAVTAASPQPAPVVVGPAETANPAPAEITRSVPEPRARHRCTVPRMVGKTLAAARRALVRADCGTAKVRYVVSAKKQRRVLVQRPRAGSKLRTGTRVTIVVARPKASR